MIHSDSHQINAHWHGLPQQARAKSFTYRHKCILMPRSLSVSPPASHFHITYLVSLINFVLRLSSLAIQHTRLYLAARRRGSPSLTISVPSVPFILRRLHLRLRLYPLSFLSSNRNSMLRVNIMESPRILGGLFFAAQGSKQISKWHSK